MLHTASQQHSLSRGCEAETYGQKSHTDEDRTMSLIEHLRSGQQCDEDGVMCIVSRQACHEAADLLEGLEAENARLRWHPIETAPKDGTVIMLWYVTKINRHASFHINIKVGKFLSDLGEWQVAGVGGNVAPTVTHWMPLPDPPTD